MTQFRALSSEECPRALFEFRYRIYVEEMGRPQRYADHAAKTIVDPLDDTGINIVAIDKDEIVGCVRTNFLRHGPLGEYEGLYGLDLLSPVDVYATSICTRLMVGLSRRSTLVTFGIMKAVYEYGLYNGIRLNFIDCNEHLIPFFLKFGYRILGQRNHSEYGEVFVLRLDLLDVDHLETVHSPFMPSLRAFLRDQTADAARAAAFSMAAE
jgi:N-acyl-L-homoserine lactone synthetase